MYDKLELKDKMKFIKYGVIGFTILLVVLISNPIVLIDTGERGIVFDKINNGIQKEELGEGMHVIVPFKENVIKMNVQMEKMIFSNKPKINKGENPIIYPRLEAASKKMQNVFVDAIVTYHVNPTGAAELYQKVKFDYPSKIVQPNVLSIIKTETGKFEVKDVLNNRDVITGKVTDELRKVLAKHNIILDGVSLSNFDFDPKYKKAIEDKQIAEVNKDKEKTLLETAEIKAQQIVKKAEAEKEANITIAEGKKQAKILEGEGIKKYNESIKQEITADVLKYKALENASKAINKWNGQYPSTYMGSENSIPLVNIK